MRRMMNQKSNVFRFIGAKFGAEMQVFSFCVSTASEVFGWDLCLLFFIVKMNAWFIRKVGNTFMF